MPLNDSFFIHFTFQTLLLVSYIRQINRLYNIRKQVHRYVFGGKKKFVCSWFSSLSLFGEHGNLRNEEKFTPNKQTLLFSGLRG